jgi:signal peptidase I
LISLAILIAVAIVCLLLTGWLLARMARRIGSARGRFSIGLLCMLVVTVIGIVAIAAEACFPAKSSATGVILRLNLSLVELIVIFLVIRLAFELSIARTFILFAILLGLLIAQLVVSIAVVRPLLVEAFVTPQRSMLPTIAPGDYFLVDKVIHPHRFDILAYVEHGPHPQKDCKRLIAFPGERLRFDGGNIYINDKLVAVPNVLQGRCHASGHGWPRDVCRYHDGQTITLGPEEYFLIGDNTDISADSRINGPTARSDLIGVVDVIYWPARKFQILR